MIVWLDQRIFGNGHGLKSPYWDDVYYWLSGDFYTWSGWFGAQLQSFQWRHPKAGERRRLAGREFRALHSNREFLWLWIVPLPICRVRVAWSGVGLPKPIAEANEALRKLQTELGRSP
jgi:hypothetical protein